MKIKIKAYTFAELSDEAQNSAKIWLNDGFLQSGLEETIELMASDWGDVPDGLKITGWEVGSYRGTDRVHLSGWLKVAEWLKANKLANKYRCLYYWADYYDLSVEIKNGRIHTEEWHVLRELCPYDLEGKRYDQVELLQEKQWESVSFEIEQWLIKEQGKLLKTLSDEFDYMWSDEYAEDTCQANDYLFNEHGEPVHHLAV